MKIIKPLTFFSFLIINPSLSMHIKQEEASKNAKSFLDPQSQVKNLIIMDQECLKVKTPESRNILKEQLKKLNKTIALQKYKEIIDSTPVTPKSLQKLSQEVPEDVLKNFLENNSIQNNEPTTLKDLIKSPKDEQISITLFEEILKRDKRIHDLETENKTLMRNKTSANKKLKLETPQTPIRKNNKRKNSTFFAQVKSNETHFCFNDKETMEIKQIRTLTLSLREAFIYLRENPKIRESNLELYEKILKIIKKREFISF